LIKVIFLSPLDVASKGTLATPINLSVIVFFYQSSTVISFYLGSAYINFLISKLADFYVALDSSVVILLLPTIDPNKFPYNPKLNLF